MTHEYEIDKRYPFKANADSVCPVPDDAIATVWFFDEKVMTARARGFFWSRLDAGKITHFMVTEYPVVKHTAWLNVYSDVRNHQTKEEADNFASDRPRSACIKIEWTEGEGL